MLVKSLRRMLYGRKGRSGIAAGIVATVTAACLLQVVPSAFGASNEVLILGSTVTGGLNSIEAQEVAAKGLTPVIADDDTWRSKSTADFGSYRALVLGDPTCGSTAPEVAVANALTWGSAVGGNVVIVGSDPVFHAGQGGDVMTRRAVDFALDQPGKTGAYISLSCYYHDAAAKTPVPLLDALRPGGFSVTGVGCYNDAHIVATHAALAGLGDADISNWSCSVHEGFDTWPADFAVLALARNFGSAYTGSDGSVGTPYILASGTGLRSFPLSLSPMSASAPAGGSHTVTAQLLDAETSLPVAGSPIRFRVMSGPNARASGTCSPSTTCATGADGTVHWTYRGASAGDDAIQAYLDRNDNGAPDLGEPQTTALMRWTVASSDEVYIALGDSYQSGEGAHSYERGTDVDGNRCHRSTVSYPYLMKGSAGVPATMTSVACSGAKIANLTNGQNGEPAQYAALSDRTKLVTIGIGGNDVDFAETIKACALGPQFSGDLWRLNQTCHGRFDKSTDALVAKLNTPDPSTRLTPLQQVYRTIRVKAPHARIMVVGYPHMFKASGNLGGCNLIWRSDEKWIVTKIDQLNQVIERNALSMGAEYGAGSAAFDGHELCGDGEAYLNGVVGLGDSESFHPNAKGHQRLKEVLLNDLSSHSPTAVMSIFPGQRLLRSIVVAPGKALATFASLWPGSDVVMQLTAPDGRVITRTTAGSDVMHEAGPTSEVYTVTNPKPGTWTVEFYGADVQPGGEPVSFTFTEQQSLNQPPIAVATATADASGTTVNYRAAGSRDPDGTIVEYEWDFGDGTIATGPTATHKYTALGKVALPSLIVTDNRGGRGFVALPPVKAMYRFAGWRPPVSNTGPTKANAGQTVPFKWRLADPAGAAVTSRDAVTGYSFDQAGATFTLTIVDGQYVLEAKTPKSWAGSKRTFTLRLNDDTTHTAEIQF